MKTAISIPDEVFREVDKVAKERHSSRSEVIVTAVKEYLERRKSNELLGALNQKVLGQHGNIFTALVQSG